MRLISHARNPEARLHAPTPPLDFPSPLAASTAHDQPTPPSQTEALPPPNGPRTTLRPLSKATHLPCAHLRRAGMGYADLQLRKRPRSQQLPRPQASSRHPLPRPGRRHYRPWRYLPPPAAARLHPLHDTRTPASAERHGPSQHLHQRRPEPFQERRRRCQSQGSNPLSPSLANTLSAPAKSRL